MTTQATEQETSTEGVYRFPADRLPIATASIDAANKRLTRAGITDRFTFDITDRQTVTHRRNDGSTVVIEYVTITLSTPTIAYGGYTFLAAVDREDAGLVTRTAPGADLAGWTPGDMTCDHCGRNIGRHHTYLLAAPDGQRVQVGSTCIAPYLGVTPKGLWALGYDPLEEAAAYDEDDYFGADGFNSGRSVTPVRTVLALALAVSDQGANFRPASWDGTTTAGLVRTALWPTAKEQQTLTTWLAETWDLAARYEDDGTVQAVLDDVAALDPGSDYAHNLQTYAAGEHVSARGFNMLVSAVKVYARANGFRAERAAAPTFTPGHMAPVGAKIAGAQVTVTKVEHRTNYDDYARREVTRTQVVMTDTDGHQVIWWANTRHDLEPGTTLTLTAGTVKKHDIYRGADQTVLTRVKYQTAADIAAVAALPAWQQALPDRHRDLPVIRAFAGATTPTELAAVVTAARDYGIGKKHLDAAVKHHQPLLGTTTPSPDAREAYLTTSTRRDDFLHGARFGGVTFNAAVAGATRAHQAGDLPDDAYAQIMQVAAARKVEIDTHERDKAEALARYAAQQAAWDAEHPEDAARYGRDKAGRAAAAQREAEWRAAWPEQAAAKDAKAAQEALDAEQAAAAFAALTTTRSPR